MTGKKTGKNKSAPVSGASESLGERIAELRAQRGLTLEQLAHITGFTKGYLSKLENGRKTPPIATLSRIAQALNTQIGTFFQSEAPKATGKVTIVRTNERQSVQRGGSAFGYDYVGLATTRTEKHMDPFIFTFPRKIDKHAFFQHQGEEFVFVLSGKVEFQVGDERFTLSKGDCAYFDANSPHRGWAVGGEAKALVVIHDPAPGPKK